MKLVYRTGYGFTNVTNRQRRSRYAASRGTRPVWLTPQWLQQTTRHEQPAQIPAPAALRAGKHHPGHADLLVETKDRRMHTVTTGWPQPVAA